MIANQLDKYCICTTRTTFGTISVCIDIVPNVVDKVQNLGYNNTIK